MIRRGLYCDVPDIIKMAAQFWQHTIYDEPFDPAHVAAMAQLCIDEQLMAVMDVMDVDGLRGFICAVKGPLLGSRQALTATEIAWWVDPGYRKGRAGIELLIFMENLVKLQGVKYFNMVSMESCAPDVAGKIYQQLGYEKTETSYSKRLF